MDPAWGPDPLHGYPGRVGTRGETRSEGESTHVSRGLRWVRWGFVFLLRARPDRSRGTPLPGPGSGPPLLTILPPVLSSTVPVPRDRGRIGGAEGSRRTLRRRRGRRGTDTTTNALGVDATVTHGSWGLRLPVSVHPQPRPHTSPRSTPLSGWNVGVDTGTNGATGTTGTHGWGR